MSTFDWVLANKIKSALGLIAAIAAVVVLPVQVVAWAEDFTTQKVRDLEIAQKAREEVIHSALRAKHDFDFATKEIEDIEEELIDLEEQMADGVVLTPTQQRKYRKLQDDLEKFEDEKEDAMMRLSLEDYDETH